VQYLKGWGMVRYDTREETLGYSSLRGALEFPRASQGALQLRIP